jgi:hypothetical protein
LKFSCNVRYLDKAYNRDNVTERTRRKQILQDSRSDGRAQSKYLDVEISKSANREVCHYSGFNNGHFFVIFLCGVCVHFTADSDALVSNGRCYVSL